MYKNVKIMLTINIDNPEFEQEIKQTFGRDQKGIANEFVDFEKCLILERQLRFCSVL